MKITLPSGRKIGEGEKPFIICEIGSNWRNFDDAKNSIALAAKCGADAVKFQAYDELALYGFTPPKEPYGGGDPFMRMAVEEHNTKPLPGTLPLEWLPKLKEKADACGIEFMCSAFSPELVDAVDPYVNIHKVASAEMTHVRILERLRAIGKPVILSTGASGRADIGKAIEALGPTPNILLYCVAAYPARFVDPGSMVAMSHEFKRLVGYSDHTTDAYLIPKSFIERGACVIEKHVNFVGADGPDAPHSLSTAEFQLMMEGIRGEIKPRIGFTAEEMGMVMRHNRRLIATRDIAIGDEIKEGVNFGIYRSLKDDIHAYTPWAVDMVNGKRAKTHIEAGNGIGPGDV